MFFFNIFTDDELDVIHKDLDLELSIDNWVDRAYIHNSHQTIVKNKNYPWIQGQIYNKTCKESIKNIIRSKLISIDSTIRKYDFDASYQIYNIGAGVFLHNDSVDMFNATFYLNKNWHVDSGGYYVYEQDSEYKLYVPKYNSCVFINQLTLVNHLVSPVTEKAHGHRLTIHCKGVPINLL